MRNILIEHNGTSAHNKIARKIGDMLEHLCESEVEQTVGADVDKVTLYNADNMKQVAEFSAVPTKRSLELHLEIMI